MSCASDCGIIAVELLTGMPGLTGPAGPQGPQGEPGPQGPQGATGSLGDTTGDITQTPEIGVVRITVTGIQSKAVSATTPTASQALIYTGSQWEPTTLTAGTY